MAGVVRLSRLRQPSKQLFTMTPRARDRVRTLLAHQTQKKGVAPVGIRIGLRKGGCNGFVYTMHFAETRNLMDEMIKEDGLTIFVDPKASMYIVGTEMDWLASKLKSEFVFTNPNATAACGCGESFSVGPPPVPGSQPEVDVNSGCK